MHTQRALTMDQWKVLAWNDFWNRYKSEVWFEGWKGRRLLQTRWRRVPDSGGLHGSWKWKNDSRKCTVLVLWYCVATTFWSPHTLTRRLKQLDPPAVSGVHRVHPCWRPKGRPDSSDVSPLPTPPHPQVWNLRGVIWLHLSISVSAPLFILPKCCCSFCLFLNCFCVERRSAQRSSASWEGEKGPSSIRPTLELFQAQRWENSWETGWSAYGPSRAQEDKKNFKKWRTRFLLCRLLASGSSQDRHKTTDSSAILSRLLAVDYLHCIYAGSLFQSLGGRLAAYFVLTPWILKSSRPSCSCRRHLTALFPLASTCDLLPVQRKKTVWQGAEVYKLPSLTPTIGKYPCFGVILKLYIHTPRRRSVMWPFFPQCVVLPCLEGDRSFMWPQSKSVDHLMIYVLYA